MISIFTTPQAIKYILNTGFRNIGSMKILYVGLRVNREEDRESESARGRVSGRGGTTALALRPRTVVWSDIAQS